MISANRVGATAPTYLRASTTRTVDGDLDLIAIEHAMNGRRVTLTPAEKVEAAHRLHDRGLPLEDIGARIGVNRDTVRAWRNKGWPRPPADPQPIDIGNASHGRSGYSKGCRCTECRAGAAAASRNRRAKAAA